MNDRHTDSMTIWHVKETVVKRSKTPIHEDQNTHDEALLRVCFAALIKR